jgi:hypothetical protein
MTQVVLDQITADRATARLQSPKETYPILTRILGDYELGAKAKKPRTGDDALIVILKDMIAKNAEAIGLLGKTQGGESEHAAEILRLENQSRLLAKYIPAKVEKVEAETALDADALRAILTEGNFTSVGFFQKHLKENYNGQYSPKTATEVFNGKA